MNCPEQALSQSHGLFCHLIPPADPNGTETVPAVLPAENETADPAHTRDIHSDVLHAGLEQLAHQLLNRLRHTAVLGTRRQHLAALR